MIPLLIAATITFTNPSLHAGHDSTWCYAVGSPLDSLRDVQLFGERRGVRGTRLLAECLAPSPGAPDSLAFPDSGYVWSVWLIAHTDNASCPSEVVGVNLTTTAPDVRAAAPGALPGLFDLLGRRVTEPPPASGIYVRRDAAGRRTFVVVVR